MKRRSLLRAAAGLLSLGLAPLAHAASVVHVIQEDPSAGHGIKHMALVIPPHAVKAGEVVFYQRLQLMTRSTIAWPLVCP